MSRTRPQLNFGFKPSDPPGKPKSVQCWTGDEFLAWCRRAARGEVWIWKVSNTSGLGRPLWTIELDWDPATAARMAKVNNEARRRRKDARWKT